MRRNRVVASLITSALLLAVWPVAAAPSASASDLNVAPLYVTGSIGATSGDSVYGSDGTLYMGFSQMQSIYSYANPNVASAVPTENFTLPSGDQSWPFDVLPYGIDVSSDGQLFAVADGGWDKARIYRRTAPSTLSLVQSAAADVQTRGVAFGGGGQLFVTSYGADRLLVYGNATGSGSLALAKIIDGLDRAYGVAVDSSGYVYVSFTAGNGPFVSGVAVFSANQIASCPSAPTVCSVTPERLLSGSSTQLDSPYGITVDASDRLYVVNSNTDSINIYRAGSNGNVAPIARVAGANTQISSPDGVSVSPTGLITTQNSNVTLHQWMTFAAPTLSPGATTGVAGVAGVGQVSLSWTAPTSNGGDPITGYLIEGNDGSGWSTAVANTGSIATSATVAGLTSGTAYTFRVSAINSIGPGTASSASSPVTPLAPAPPPPSMSPVTQDLSGVVGVPVSPTSPFLLSNFTLVPGFSVSPALPPGLSIDPATGVVSGTPSVSHPSTQHLITATTSGNSQSASSTLQVSVTLPAAPDAPLSVAAAAGDASALVTWQAAASTGPVTSYTVSSNPGGRTCSTAALACRVTGLTNGRRYTFTVTATNPGGTSAPSQPSAVITPKLPVKPSIVIEGTRTGRTIEIAGSTTGIAPGSRVTPWIRKPGMTEAEPARPVTVEKDGSFAWVHRVRATGALRVFVTWGNAKSNVVRIAVGT
jgi:hypothetical protein